MRIKFLFAVCVSLFAISCNPSEGTGENQTVDPPVIENRLASVTVSENGSVNPSPIFGADYKDGRITRIKIAEWSVEDKIEVPETSFPENVVEQGNLLNKASAVMSRLTKADASDWMYDVEVKYEKDAVILYSEEDETSLILKQNKAGLLTSVIYKDSEEELDAMNFSYNSEGRLKEYNIYNYYYDTEGDWVETTTLSFEYSGDSMSSATVSLKEDNETADKFVFLFDNITEKNSQGIFLPVLDPTGLLTAFNTLDIIGNKTAFLPKNGGMKLLLFDGENIPDIPGLSIYMNLDYAYSADGYIENIKYGLRMEMPFEEPEEVALDFGFTFDR